jgi:hypothetical protein
MAIDNSAVRDAGNANKIRAKLTAHETALLAEMLGDGMAAGKTLREAAKAVANRFVPR